MARLTPYAYRSGTSPLHRLDAGWKLLGLLALSVASFSFGVPGLVFSISSVVTASAIARIAPPRLFAGVGPILIATIFVLALRSVAFVQRTPSGFFPTIDFDGLREGSIFALSVLVAFAGAAVLFATTTSAQLREAVAGAEETLTVPLTRFLRSLPSAAGERAAARLERTTISLVIALTLGFLPRVFEVWEAAEEARKARCGKRGIFGVAAMIPLVIERLMEMAAETARAMEGRGATLGR